MHFFNIPEGKTVAASKVMIVFLAIVWGLGNPVTKLGYDEGLTPFFCLSVRFTMAFAVFALFFGKRMIREIKGFKIKNLLIISSLTALTFISCNIALMLTAATITGFLMSLAVVFTPFLSIIMLKAGLDKRNIIIIGAIVIGLYLMCGVGTSVSFGIGEILGLMTSVFYAFTLMYTAKEATKGDAITLAGVQSGFTAIVCWVCAFIFEPAAFSKSLGTTEIFVIVYLGLGCTFLAYVIQNVTLKYVTPVFLSLALCSEPVFTAVASYFMLGERLSLPGTIGAALILVGTIAASLLPSNEPYVEAEAEAELRN